ncbi:ABC transporter substrate-binding protein [Aquibacillus salsiterrae]|uniref:ABC transporter substrate-binding protein n=1 Tax=Aquibacillus salsiterrae TaxID=2950439 RepID=A0A9X4AGR6_9BACI|nr:ABC transporter substrate-binding protein [Aquibacillus salsiterrae]MDC3417565.1 ABC transporter substrate-binding protein [Aquibacillus salsiterrae]
MSTTWKQASTLVLAFLLALFLVGCNTGDNAESSDKETIQDNTTQETEENTEESTDTQEDKEQQSDNQTTYPLTVTDATGEEVTFDSEPTKLVSLIPSETEVLFALGAGEEVLAVDDYSDFPKETADLPKLGSTYSGLNVEELIALQPDVVFINAGLQADVAQELRDQGLTVFGSNPGSITDVIESIETIGLILNNQEQAEAVTKEMTEKIDYVKEKVANAEPKKVYAEFSAGWSFGTGDFANDLITLAGGENIFADVEGWFEVNPEEVINRNPEVILFTSGEDGVTEDNKEAITTRDGFEVIDAVKNDQVIGIDSNKASRVGPRITDSLIEIFEAIHPELAE